LDPIKQLEFIAKGITTAIWCSKENFPISKSVAFFFATDALIEENDESGNEES